MKSKWNIYRLCTELDQRRNLFGESEHSPELTFLSSETLAPNSSQALGVNQRHKGYDVRLVTNDNIMCTETTWQFAAINLGARQGSFFRARQVRFNIAQDETYFCLRTVCCEFSLAVPWKKICLILCSISWARQEEDFEPCVKNPKCLKAKSTSDKLLDKLLLDRR